MFFVSGPTTPGGKPPGLGIFPLSLATTDGIAIAFFSSGYWDVSLLRVLPYVSIYSTHNDILLRDIGLLHWEICGSEVACTYPQLIAACHVLHRLLSPRHSPSARTAWPPKKLRPHPEGISFRAQYGLPGVMSKNSRFFACSVKTTEKSLHTCVWVIKKILLLYWFIWINKQEIKRLIEWKFKLTECSCQRASLNIKESGKKNILQYTKKNLQRYGGRTWIWTTDLILIRDAL